jgi:CubicO group peptidase (beta-lactamase class C family)
LEADWVPGKAAGYHVATSWYILAEALTRIAEIPFPELVQTGIFDPLSMDDSWIRIPETSYFSYDDRMAWMYRTQGESEPDKSLNSVVGAARVHPGGNGRGPIRELGRFYEMLLAGGGEVVKSETVELFTSRHRAGMFDQTFQHEIDWGLGFIIDSNRYAAETIPYGFGRHASPSTFGHDGS